MKYLYYIQGVHAVRVFMIDEMIMGVERYDKKRPGFVSDFKILKRINDDMDTKKISVKEFWEYIAHLRTFSLN